MRNEIQAFRDDLTKSRGLMSKVKDSAIYYYNLAVCDKLDAILANPGDDYKRGVVDGMTASANFVAIDFMQGRDNDRMRLAESLRDEAKRVEQEK